MNINLDSSLVLEIKIREREDEEVVWQRQVNQWLQRVYGAMPIAQQPSSDPEVSEGHRDA
jgi:hypothetical protein